MTGLEWTHKCSKRNSVINIHDFPARNASGRASIALRRSANAVPACRRWSPPASCTYTCSAAVDAILHSFKNAQVVILDNDRSLSRITTCKCAFCTDCVAASLRGDRSLPMSSRQPSCSEMGTISLTSDCRGFA